jgi:hypothetical protein
MQKHRQEGRMYPVLLSILFMSTPLVKIIILKVFDICVSEYSCIRGRRALKFPRRHWLGLSAAENSRLFVLVSFLPPPSLFIYITLPPAAPWVWSHCPFGYRFVELLSLHHIPHLVTAFDRTFT